MFLTGLRKKYRDQLIPWFENLKKLLKMWKDFYNFRLKDSTSLQNSTTIPFNLWQECTDLLLNMMKMIFVLYFININQLYKLKKIQKLINVYGFIFFFLII